MEDLREYNILFLEDNITFAENTITFLKMYFNHIYYTSSIESAVEMYRNKDIHMIISDIKLNNENGLDFVSKIREMDKDIPIIVLSAHKDEDFLFKAIDLNITAYKVKPMKYNDYMELFEKCIPILQDLYGGIVHIKDNIYYDSNTKVIIKNKNLVPLSKKEILFMELLLKNKKRIITKQMMIDEVWKSENMTEAAFKNFLLRLRKKCDKDFLITVSGFGVKLNIEEELKAEA